MFTVFAATAVSGGSLATDSTLFDYSKAIDCQSLISSRWRADFHTTIDLVLYRLSFLFCLIRSSHRPKAHEDGFKGDRLLPVFIKNQLFVVATPPCRHRAPSPPTTPASTPRHIHLNCP
ncbi:hypothetical protein J6590_065282 [Homalodisca vitripennis]|nr:hypothetical protein J6590_065282 [Homalodisca vitripennis]